MLYIGAGGWAYFKVPEMDPLAAYSKAFDFVEVNSTFYTTPSIETVRSWRQREPDNFMFSVRCHKDMTHKYLISPGKESYEILNQSQFDDVELVNIDRSAKERGRGNVYLTVHGARMYSDAARLKVHEKIGNLEEFMFI